MEAPVLGQYVISLVNIDAEKTYQNREGIYQPGTLASQLQNLEEVQQQ